MKTIIKLKKLSDRNERFLKLFMCGGQNNFFCAITFNDLNIPVVRVSTALPCQTVERKRR